ncbi:MAG: LolA family protein, partial [Tepidiformaceae bacterium]
MNFRRKHSDNLDPSQLTDTPVALEQDLFALYQVPTPTLKFSAPVVEPSGHRGRWMKVRRPVAAIAAAGAIAAALLFGPGLLGGGTTPVNAEQIFTRASAAANASAAQTSYHLVATTSGLKGVADAQSETWSRDAAHTRNQSSDSGMIINGDQLWLWTTNDGQLRAVHAASGGAAFASTDTLPGSLAQLLASYGSDGCQTATLGGEATVAGRQAYELTLTPSDNCRKAAGSKVAEPAGSLHVWVDKQTFITLKTEAQDANGNAVYQYQVTEIEVGQAIPDSVFQYQPPSGVDVVQVQDAAQAKSALAGTAGKAGPTPGADATK